MNDFDDRGVQNNVVEGQQSTYEYLYDDAGSLVEDKHKELNITYNAFDKPTEMTWTNVNNDDFTMELTYDGTGGLLRKELLKNDVPIDTIEYFGGIQYDGGKLDVISVPQGRAIPTCDGEFRYDYYYTDHLGNVRAVVNSELDGQGDVVIEKLTDYYPFGTEMYNRNYQTTDYRYAYQGQEKDDKTGWSSFQLRMYDGRIGRWNTTDPKGQYFSPYLAMGNNPVSQIDPDGGASGMPGMYVAPTELNTFSTYDALHWENFKNMSPQEYWRSQSQRAIFKFMWNSYMEDFGGDMYDMQTFYNQFSTLSKKIYGTYDPANEKYTFKHLVKEKRPPIEGEVEYQKIATELGIQSWANMPYSVTNFKIVYVSIDQVTDMVRNAYDAYREAQSSSSSWLPKFELNFAFGFGAQIKPVRFNKKNKPITPSFTANAGSFELLSGRISEDGLGDTYVFDPNELKMKQKFGLGFLGYSSGWQRTWKSDIAGQSRGSYNWDFESGPYHTVGIGPVSVQNEVNNANFSVSGAALLSFDIGVNVKW